MTPYRQQLDTGGRTPSMADIIALARAQVPEEYQTAPWRWPRLEHGVAVLDTDEALACYMTAYGHAHTSKMQASLALFPWHLLDGDFEVVDWGCGQGLATCCLIEELRKRRADGNLRRITLVDPSGRALARAVDNVEAVTADRVLTVPRREYLPGNSSQQTFRPIEAVTDICIHLFSNILDLTDIDLRALAALTETGSRRNIYLCTGPLNAGNLRIDAFSRYFTPGLVEMYADIRSASFGMYPNGRYFTCRALGFVAEADVESGRQQILTTFAPVPMRSSFIAKVLGPGGSVKPEFEIQASFDLGAEVTTDPDPILAVLSNIVGRGSTTLCSPKVARTIATHTGVLEEKDSDTELLFVSPPGKHNDADYVRDMLTRVAQVQTTLLRVMLTGRVDLNRERLTIAAWEGDVPCVALALDDVAEMYNNLCRLSDDYSNRRFPEIDLTVVSPGHATSPLHLGALALADTNDALCRRNFDLTLEVVPGEAPAEASPPRFRGSGVWARINATCMAPEPRRVVTGRRVRYRSQQSENGPAPSELVYFLQLLFRKRHFRPGQLPILDRALALKSVIGLLPTGGGKSLTYQLAAMLQPGVTVVVDPLKSLMEDQVHGLLATGIDSCAYINSQLTPDERREREAAMEQGLRQFVFLSPERLSIGTFRRRLRNMHHQGVYFAYGVVDEVHCVSEWGQEFRFPYLHVGRNLYNFLQTKEPDGHVSLFALTATASFDVLADVERELTGSGKFPVDPQAVVRHENCNRLELQYRVVRVPIEFQTDLSRDLHLAPGLNYPVKVGKPLDYEARKREAVKELVSRVPGMLAELQEEDSLHIVRERFAERESLEATEADEATLRIGMPDNYLERGRGDYPWAGIVFCPHVGIRSCSGISVVGNAMSLSSVCDVGKFHGRDAEEGLPDTSIADMERFRDNRIPLMVATKAFGMGIDKPNVRFTIHVNYSNSLEAFVQEAGRAGRDRRVALSLLLVSDYHLKRIRRTCQVRRTPIWEIRGKWFRATDLDQLIAYYGLHDSLAADDIEECTPASDLVRVSCPNSDAKGNPLWFKCDQCPPQLCRDCQIKHLPDEMRFEYVSLGQLENWAAANRIYIPKERLEYQSPDFRTMMYFYDNSFKGARYEWAQMDRIVNTADVEWWMRDSEGILHPRGKSNGIAPVIHALGLQETAIVKLAHTQADYNAVAKSIYRLCLLGLVDDFTQEYSSDGGAFSLHCRRKPQGSYYTALLDYLCRYYTREQAVREVERCSVMPKGQSEWPEVRRCLVFLTQFVYAKIARKRRRAIEDMRDFCLGAIRSTADWKEVNEELKDELFFYFNSKYARAGYETEGGEPFSLLDDSREGRVEDFWIVEKYLRVVDPDVTGVSGSANDSLKHLQGAVRLIMRGGDGANAALNMLGAFAIVGMGMTDHPDVRARLEDYFLTGYTRYRGLLGSGEEFYSCMQKFFTGINGPSRHVASQPDIDYLEGMRQRTELNHHLHWIEDFSQKYTQ